jgi:ABC-type uncharacterized transport system substrate-binding protein
MRALIFCIVLSMLSVLPVWAADVLIVQSGRSAAYAEALRGFKDIYKGSSHTIVLADYATVDVVRLVKEEQPQLVLAVGDKALEATRKVRQVPVVGLMALALNLAKEPAGMVSGVGVMPSPERYLELFRSMGVKRVGVVCDPSRSGFYLKRAQQAAQRLGIQLVTRVVHSSHDVMSRLEQLKGQVDALWMLPDTTTVTAETVEAWFSFSSTQKVPLVSFSEQYLKSGASASLDVDRVDLGRQAGELTNSLLNMGTRLPAQDARTVQLRTNNSVLVRLGIPFPSLAQ